MRRWMTAKLPATSLLIIILLFSADKIFAGGEEKTYIIQESTGSYWYCPLWSPACFWHSLFHDRYYCRDFKNYSGIKCEETDPPIEKIDPCKFPPDIDVGYCYREWKGYNYESEEKNVQRARE